MVPIRGPKPRDRLRGQFYRRATLEVARDLLGRVLCRRRDDGRVLRGRIVEVEAYDGPDDRASHAHRGPTPRNAPMFEGGGIAYVYQIYGVHFCCNVVCGKPGYPAAILLRGAETPVAGLSASGPGRLCRTFGIDREFDGTSLLGRRTLWVEHGIPVADADVRRTPRVNIDYAGAWVSRRYRFLVAGHPDVSRPG